MKHRLIALFALAALSTAACSESKRAVAAAQPAPLPAPERLAPTPAVAVMPSEREKTSAGGGEEAKSDAQQIAAFEQKVPK